MLRHSVPDFLLIFSRLCVLSGGTQRRAFALGYYSLPMGECATLLSYVKTWRRGPNVTVNMTVVGSSK